MKKEYYSLLKKDLMDLQIFKIIDYDLNQYQQSGDDHVPTTPGAYIRFDTIPWDTLLQSVQMATTQFTITVVSETAYGDERDILNEDKINHLNIESEVYQKLMNHRHLLSDVPGYGSLAGTEQDGVLMESIIRGTTQPHKKLDNLIITSVPYSCVVYDYSAMPEMQSVLADLTIDVELLLNYNLNS